MSKAQRFLAILLVLVAFAGIIVGLILVKQRQDLRKSASLLSGNATVSLTPETGTYNVGDTIPVSIFFNTDGTAISSVDILVNYNYSGSTPEITAGDIQISPDLMGTGDWTCPVQEVTASNGLAGIEVNCANINAEGFTSTTDTLLATFNLIINQIPANNPTILSFDPAESVISDLNGDDILLTPTSTGTYTIGSVATNTPTPTSSPNATNTPTPTSGSTPTSVPNATNTPTPTSGPTATTSPNATNTPTPTRRLSTTPSPTGQTLPDAGVSTPSLVGMGLGLFAILAALILAL